MLSTGTLGGSRARCGHQCTPGEDEPSLTPQGRATTRLTVGIGHKPGLVASLATGGTKTHSCILTFFAARAGALKPRQPLCNLNAFDSLAKIRDPLLQFRILRLGLLQDGDVGVGVSPECEEVLIRGAGFGSVSLQYVRAPELQMSQRPNGLVLGAKSGQVIESIPSAQRHTGWPIQAMRAKEKPGKLPRAARIVCVGESSCNSTAGSHQATCLVNVSALSRRASRWTSYGRQGSPGAFDKAV